MERFLSIDWNPRLEDVIDDVFLDDEKYEHESVMYKIMVGAFKDPFDDMYDEYEQVDINIIKPFLPKDDENESISSDAKKMKNEWKYVPGIIKPPFKLPRLSCLNKVQQAICLRVLLKFSASEKPELSESDREELQTYLGLKDDIAKEQEEFLELAKSKWSGTDLNLVCEDYIEARWRSKMERIKEFPKYYAEVATIPFVGHNTYNLNYQCTCSKSGRVKEIKLPTLHQPYTLNVNSAQLNQMFPITKTGDKSVPCYKLPVSQDTNCHNLAEENDVDLVISSSGLKCLANNIGPKYTKSWALPTYISSQNGKNIIYIDKPIPPTANTVSEKNTWVYKYILRYFMIYREKPNLKNCQKNSMQNRTEKVYDDDLFGDELVQLGEDENELNVINDEMAHVPQCPVDTHQNRKKINTKNEEIGICNNPKLKDSQLFTEEMVKFEEDENEFKVINDELTHLPQSPINTDENGKKKNIKNGEVGICYAPISRDSQQFTDGNIINNKSKGKTKKQKNTSECQSSGSDGVIPDNVSYQIFTLYPQSTEQSELMKNNTGKAYKILVRSKTDGFENLSDGTRQFVKLAPKLEHQAGLGAEAVTLDEAIRQWISLAFQPNTILARVRIWAQKCQVLQIEKRTTASISNELQRLYNLHPEDSLTLLYNTIETLKGLSPNHYLLRHTPRDGAFATIYRDTDSLGKGDINLHAMYQDRFYTIPMTPWPLLDKLVTTPMLRHFERMPAMFYPCSENNRWNKGCKKPTHIKGKTNSKKGSKVGIK